LYSLALVALGTKDPAAAERYFAAALDVLDRHIRRFGGPEDTRATFGARVRGYYDGYVALLLDQGRNAEAFHVLERSRARVLLGILAERDLTFDDLPPDLEASRRRNATELDAVQRELAAVAPSEESQKMLRARLTQLSTERAHIVEQIRQATPRVAAVHSPEPLTLAGTREMLDPGTLVLSFLVSADATKIFLVPPPGEAASLSVLTVHVSESALRESVRGLLEGIQTRTVAGQQAFRAQSRALYDLLIRPTEAAVAGASRILVIPDGPLHALPFEALLRTGDQFLVQWKPLHRALSATVYAELRSRPRWTQSQGSELVAFGDPVYARIEGSSPRAAMEGAAPSVGPSAPLPFSRDEVNGIARHVSGPTELFLGPSATETRAKSVPRHVRYLHFAVHSFVDRQSPLNSALVLSTPAAATDTQDNGLLQAWELYERVRWNADLVALSACDTALGAEFSGEGLMGLTHAIQFAGARSVLSSFWRVDDRRTSQLMQSFYGHLRRGLAKDEALRAAQVEMIKSPYSSSPAHWAAFTINGDWR
jgi:CHAT domain-containing protein